MAVRRWILPELNSEAAAELAQACEINPFLALMLTTRQITTPEDAISFLVGDAFDDPFAFADMDAAVERLETAIDAGESIMIYGDYDVDGITATVLLYTYLQKRGARVSFRLPTREGDGYGLHTAQIDEFLKQGVSLLVTVDNGITAVDEAAYAKANGMDVIITDHHQPRQTLPPAVAVVDPHRADCPSGCVGYAGVGVAFMLVCALEGDADAVMEEYGDLLALGMLADMMPLVGTVRGLVRRGLTVLNHLRRPGIRALLDLAGQADKEINSTRAVFTLAPRLNAAGRMENPLIAAEMLMEQDPEKARTLAERVHALNVERQTAETAIFSKIEQRLSAEPSLLADRVLVVEGEDWPIGIIGILAARLCERYGKPAIVLCKKDGIAKGSGRSLEGFSLFDALCACADLLTTFGGHELAAGVSLPVLAVPDFRTAINRYAAQTSPAMPVPTLRLDVRLRPGAIDVEKLVQLAALEPFGNGNPSPVFGLYGMRLDNIAPIGKGQHLRLSFSKNEARLNVLKFHTTAAEFPIPCGAVCNLAVSLEKNVYKGVISPTVLLKDIRYAATDEQTLIDAHQAFDALMRRESDCALCLPEREQMGQLYRYLVRRQGFFGTLEQLYYAVEPTKLSLLSIRTLLEIWQEAGLMTVEDTGESLRITVLPTNGKTDLTKTPLWQFLWEEV